MAQSSLPSYDSCACVCPTCGTLHQNDFTNKFSLIADVDTCRSFQLESREDLERAEQEIAVEKKQFMSFDEDIIVIEAILNETKGDLRVRDILESESERLVDEAFATERRDIDLAVRERDGEAEASSVVMKSYADRKREKSIKDFFAEKLHRFALHLQVPTLPDSFLPKTPASGFHLSGRRRGLLKAPRCGADFAANGRHRPRTDSRPINWPLKAKASRAMLGELLAGAWHSPFRSCWQHCL